MELLAVFTACYLLGSVSFAYIAGMMKGVDLRRAGSGTLGARNVGRVVGKGAAAAVLLLDALKGAGAVYIAMLLSSHPLAPMVGWLGVVCGHGWSVFLRFKGGKGLASSAGALILISPAALAMEVMVGATSLALLKNAHAAGVLMTLALPAAVHLAGGDLSAVLASIPVSLAILTLHRKDILDMMKTRGGEGP